MRQSICHLIRLWHAADQDPASANFCSRVYGTADQGLWCVSACLICLLQSLSKEISLRTSVGGVHIVLGLHLGLSAHLIWP